LIPFPGLGRILRHPYPGNRPSVSPAGTTASGTSPSTKSSDPTMTALNTSCNPRNKNITG